MLFLRYEVSKDEVFNDLERLIIRNLCCDNIVFVICIHYGIKTALLFSS